MNPLVIPIIFFAVLIQSMLGFGAGLIAMPMLIAVIGPDVARPAFALMGLVSGPIFVWKYRHDWQWADIWRLVAAALFGIPVGMFLADSLDEHTFMIVLGILLVAYASYGLMGSRLPKLAPRWSYFFGLFAGFLHSAYSVGGPPLVLYCASQDWQPRRFRGNMQLLFLLMGLLISSSHLMQGNISLPVLQNTALMIPAMLAALGLGFSLDKYVKPSFFRKAVLTLLIFLGLSLIFSS